MKKVFIVVVGILVAVSVAYFLLFAQTDLFIPHYRANDYPQPYYQNLAKQCESRGSIGCCLASVKEMQAGNYQLALEDKCPPHYGHNMMECIDSYQWCQPESQ